MARIISFALVERNIIYENGVGGGSGINCDGVSDSIFRNNLLYNNHASGISLYGIDGAMLFFLIGKVYNHSVPPRIVPPLLLVTGKGEEKRAQELLREPGVRGLVPKPFAINRLIEKVKECLPGVETVGV